MNVRLYDRVLADSTIAEPLRNALRAVPTRLLASNVARYFYVESRKETWSAVDDFPNLAPPFPSFWVEAKVPMAVQAPARPGVGIGGGVQAGFLMTYVEVGDRERLEQCARAGWTYVRNPPASARWFGFVTLILALDRGHPLHHLDACFAVTATGSLATVATEDGRQAYFCFGMPAETEARLVADGRSGELEKDLFAMSDWLPIPFFTTSLLHCKNVTLHPHEPPRPRKAKKNRHRPPRAETVYHVIDIDPMRQILRTEGRSGEVGLRRALHICRGHFADHSARGLFGREHMRGVFWVPMHVRGKVTQGTIVKDYRVRAPARADEASEQSPRSSSSTLPRSS